MKKYIFSLVCLCCALLPALEGQAALHEHPEYPDLRKSDANIVGHILDTLRIGFRKITVDIAQ